MHTTFIRVVHGFIHHPHFTANLLMPTITKNLLPPVDHAPAVSLTIFNYFRGSLGGALSDYYMEY